MTAASLRDLSAAGVAVWLDDLSRPLIRSGGLADLITGSAVVGVTSNPTIFAKALNDSEAYSETLRALARADTSVEDAVLRIMVEDIREACEVMAPVYEATGGRDGRVSIEVDPHLAHDTAATLAQARQLWQAVDRPNLFVKIPATKQGLPAIAAATAEGININITLIFSLDRYRAVMQAYLSGLERAHESGKDLSEISSVASFFVSRVDTAVDEKLTELGTPEAHDLLGRAGIANARLAYAAYEDAFSTPRWEALADAGATKQRPLWASTGVKNPDYRDTLYVEELIGPDCINTMPSATLRAFADHGVVRGNTITEDLAAASQQLDELERLGISYVAVTDELEKEGVKKFIDSWGQLAATVSDGLARVAGTGSSQEAGQ